jgi:hypothetical protein
VDEAASKDRRSTLLFSSILIVLASGYASLDSAHHAGGIKIKDIAGVIKEINISLKHILFLLLALSTYYLISFLVASYRSLKRWGLRRQVWQQRAASLVTVPYLESQKALESVKEAAEEMKNKATRRAEQLRKSSGTDAIADVDDPMDFMRDFEAIKDLEADFDEANKRVKVVTDTATVMQRSRLISICIDIVFPCMLYIGSVFTLVAWLRHQ